MGLTSWAKACWESRSRVLLMTRVRKCLAKWGYSAQDLRAIWQRKRQCLGSLGRAIFSPFSIGRCTHHKLWKGLFNQFFSSFMPHSSHIPPSWHPHWQAAQVLVEFVDEDGDGNLNLSESFGAEISPEVVHFHLQMCSSDFAGFSCSAWERDPQFQNPERSQRDSKALKVWVSRRKLSWLVWCQWFGQFSGKPGAMMHDATGNSTHGIFHDQDQHADNCW